MKIFVLSFHVCKDYVSRLPNEKTSIISIRDPDATPYFTLDMNKNISNILTLNFSDTFQKYQTTLNFDDKKAESIVDFIYGSIGENVENILIHCNLGMSRSKTVGIVAYEKLQNESIINDKRYNKYIYDILTKVWEEKQEKYTNLSVSSLVTNFIKKNNY